MDILLGAIWYVSLLFSLTLHEAAHAWAARRGGDPTAYHGGQVSLDPRPHIRREPFGMVLVPLLSFAYAGWMIGWASTPYDPRWADQHPRRAAWMSLAGPAANLLIVVGSALLIRTGLFLGVFEAPPQIAFARIVLSPFGGIWDTAGILLSVLFTLNLLLLVFNLIPLPPLDGSGAVTLLLSDEKGRRLRSWLQNPQFSFLGILVAWFLIREIFTPVFLLAINLLYPEYGYH